MKWFRMIAVQLLAMVAFIVLIAESDVYTCLQLFGIKVVAGVVLIMCAYFAVKWHREGKMPQWWYKTISEE